MVQFTDGDFTDYTDLQMTDHRWVDYRCWITDGGITDPPFGGGGLITDGGITDAGLQMLDRPYCGQICLRHMIAVVTDVQKLDNR